MTTSPSPTPGGPFTEALFWKITEPSRLRTINLLTLPLAVAFGSGFVWWAKVYGKAPQFDWGVRDGLLFLVGIVLLLAIHEATHWVLMRIFGANPRFGFWPRGGMFYAKAPGSEFSRRQYAAVVLGPLVILSVWACVAIVLFAGSALVWFVALWGVVNATAANADVLIAAAVFRQPSAARFVDELQGFRVRVLS